MQRIWEIKESEAYPEAEKLFLESCRLDPDDPGQQHLLAPGFGVRDKILPKIRIRACMEYYDASVYHDSALHIGEQSLSCGYFQRIPASSVVGVYLFLLTAGDYSMPGNITDEFFADVWGSSYAEAGVNALRRCAEEDMRTRFADAEVQLSRDFGPGYYGMDVMEAIKLYSILGGEEIGVRVTEYGMLIPQKSCSGLFFVWNDLSMKAEPACVSCLGEKQNCAFCSVRVRG